MEKRLNGEKIKLLIKLIRRLRNKFKWISFKCLDWLLTVKYCKLDKPKELKKVYLQKNILLIGV
ncbi:hypothetical protein AWRIB548_535 [Oenococcus oeni AWRIB548]|nr:hypothetical protein AWRIB548_535 [Oenococcus oeni AWRIB548]PDH95234.1 hypothetical protein AO469_09110 [Oenococcus oeni]